MRSDTPLKERGQRQRRIQTFDTRASALAWSLTPRPDAQARLLSLALEIDRIAHANHATVRDEREAAAL